MNSKKIKFVKTKKKSNKKRKTKNKYSKFLGGSAFYYMKNKTRNKKYNKIIGSSKAQREGFIKRKKRMTNAKRPTYLGNLTNTMVARTPFQIGENAHHKLLGYANEKC